MKSFYEKSKSKSFMNMKKSLILFLFCTFLSGCVMNRPVESNQSVESVKLTESIKPVESTKPQEEIESVNCAELEKQTWHYRDKNERVNYEARKKQIDYYFDRCTRENYDRWNSLGMEALVVSDQVETEQEKIDFLKISYENFSKSLKDDGFMAALQASAIGKEYYKINDYDNALIWFEKAKIYYEKTNHTRLGALPEFMGDTYWAMGDYMTAMDLYAEAYENICQVINKHNEEECLELSKKMESL